MDDFEVTPAMRAYLARFDEWLRDPTHERERTRVEALADLRAGTLSPREREVLTLRVGGLSRAEIAVRLGISPRTVEHHFGRIHRKAGTCDPFRLCLWAVMRGLV